MSTGGLACKDSIHNKNQIVLTNNFLLLWLRDYPFLTDSKNSVPV